MGGSSSADRASDQAARKQAEIAQQLFTQTDPLRRGMIDRSQQFLTNGVDNSPTFSAYKAAAEPQYASARESIIADTPMGGGLTAALAELQTGKARDLTEARGAIHESELARALTLGTGTVGTSMAGFGNSAAIQAQRAQAKAERDTGVYMALGEATGALLGGGKS